MYLSQLGTHLVNEQGNYVGKITSLPTHIQRDGYFYSDLNEENEEYYQYLKTNNKL